MDYPHKFSYIKLYRWTKSYSQESKTVTKQNQKIDKNQYPKLPFSLNPTECVKNRSRLLEYYTPEYLYSLRNPQSSKFLPLVQSKQVSLDSVDSLLVLVTTSFTVLS